MTSKETLDTSRVRAWCWNYPVHFFFAGCQMAAA